MKRAHTERVNYRSKCEKIDILAEEETEQLGKEESKQIIREKSRTNDREGMEAK